MPILVGMMKEVRANTDNGFTLIELLVVIAIIGILAAIAIPQYAQFRLQGFNKAAQSDLRNAITAQEAVLNDRNSYWDCMNSGCNDPALPGMRVTPGVSIACTPRDTGRIFQCSARHSRGNITYYYDSENSVFWEI